MGEGATTAQLLYGNPGGEPAEGGAIESSLDGGGMGAICAHLRNDGDHDTAKEVDAGRRQLAGVMKDLGFSQAATQEFAGLMREYWDRPREGEEAKKNLERALEELQKEWKGKDLEDNVKGATELVGLIRSKVPWVGGFLSHSGLECDARLLRILGGVSKHRRATSKK